MKRRAFLKGLVALPVLAASCALIPTTPVHASDEPTSGYVLQQRLARAQAEHLELQNARDRYRMYPPLIVRTHDSFHPAELDLSPGAVNYINYDDEIHYLAWGGGEFDLMNSLQRIQPLPEWKILND